MKEGKIIRMERRGIGENTENSFEKFCCKANMRLFL